MLGAAGVPADVPDSSILSVADASLDKVGRLSGCAAAMRVGECGTDAGDESRARLCDERR